MSAPSLRLIAAVARNGVIGREGRLPWNLPDDLRHFKALTMGHPILMGRRTFESIGRPLPGRRSVVISRTLTNPPAGIELASSLPAALQRLADVQGSLFVIGGASLYAEALPIADVMHLTEIDQDVVGDVKFPPFNRAEWRLIEEVPHGSDLHHAMAFRFCTYERC